MRPLIAWAADVLLGHRWTCTACGWVARGPNSLDRHQRRRCVA